jgi:hypothetical protein
MDPGTAISQHQRNNLLTGILRHVGLLLAELRRQMRELPRQVASR